MLVFLELQQNNKIDFVENWCCVNIPGIKKNTGIFILLIPKYQLDPISYQKLFSEVEDKSIFSTTKSVIQTKYKKIHHCNTNTFNAPLKI